MSSLNIYYQDGKKIKASNTLDILEKIERKQIIWIDLINVDEETESRLEDFLKIYIQEDEEMEEIEMSSRYAQTDDSIAANSNFLNAEFVTQPVSFIIKNSVLVSVRDSALNSFSETTKHIFTNSGNFPTGFHVLVDLLETRIEFDADLIENTTDYITNLSKNLSADSDVMDEDTLLQIKELQEKVMIIRQNIIDKQRVVSNILKCPFFPKELQPRLTMIIKDINSLFEYTRFGFDRLDYLQDTFLGLVNLQQNRIVKIFTVVSVIFLPPTLIASMYGMNFDFMPELHWHYGYPFAIVLMIFFACAILAYFNWKKWI